MGWAIQHPTVSDKGEKHKSLRPNIGKKKKALLINSHYGPVVWHAECEKCYTGCINRTSGVLHILLSHWTSCTGNVIVWQPLQSCGVQWDPFSLVPLNILYRESYCLTATTVLWRGVHSFSHGTPNPASWIAAGISSVMYSCMQDTQHFAASQPLVSTTQAVSATFHMTEKKNYAGSEHHSPHWLRKIKPLWYRVP